MTDRTLVGTPDPDQPTQRTWTWTHTGQRGTPRTSNAYQVTTYSADTTTSATGTPTTATWTSNHTA